MVVEVPIDWGGNVIFEALTATAPFQGASAAELASSILAVFPWDFREGQGGALQGGDSYLSPFHFRGF